MRFNCPQCGKPSEVPDSASGRTARCPHCQATFTLPAIGPPPAPIAPPVGLPAVDDPLKFAESPSPHVATQEVELSGWHDTINAALKALGILIVAGSIFAGVSQNSEYPLVKRFHDDNAVGATANVLERIEQLLPAWRWLALGMALLFYAKLREIAALLRRR